jgi:hydrogenase maturation factor
MCLAIPAKVVELFPQEPTRALVDVAGVRRHIDTGLLAVWPGGPSGVPRSRLGLAVRVAK